MIEISIILPIYNSESYLKKCLISIQKQTYINYEVIAINDGSIDNSERIFYETVKNDSRFHLYNQKNKGIGITRNLGLLLCKSELITFIDSDDFIHEQYLETLLNGINDCDISIIGHNICFQSLTIPIHFINNKYFNQKQAIKHLMKDIQLMNYCWGKCYKKKLWKDIRFPIYKTYEDVETIYKIFLNANDIYVSNKILYYYIIHPNSLSQQKNRYIFLKNAYKKQMNTIIQYYPQYKYYGYFNILKASIFNYFDKNKKDF